MSSEFFGKIFDFNNNGKLDIIERTADFITFEKMVNNTNGSEDDDNNYEEI